MPNRKGRKAIHEKKLGNSQQDKIMGDDLDETAKFVQVKKDTDKSIHSRVSEFPGEKDKDKNVNTERTQMPGKFFIELAKNRKEMLEKNIKKTGRLESYHLLHKENSMKSPFWSNFSPLKRKREEAEEKAEKEHVYDDDYEVISALERSCKDTRYNYSIYNHVPVPSPDFLPPPPPPPPPDHLDDFNPGIQQQHVNFNPPDIDNNEFNQNIINILPPNHNNPAPPPPDYLE